MTKLTHFFCLFFINGFLPICLISKEIHPDPQLSVDVSFLAVDLKYNQDRGAQICEIQHGVQSSFKGGTYADGGYSSIAQNLVKALDRFHDQSWVVSGTFHDPEMQKEFLNNKKWTFKTLQNILQNKQFLANANLPIADPSDINSYHGFVFLKLNQKDRASLKNQYPGIIFIDHATHKYRGDKFKMTNLLMGHPLTEKHKPKWGLYSLEKEEGLIEQINKDIGSDLLVIKPLHDSLGNGVIILSKEELNDIMDYLFKRKPQGISNTDPAYEFWLTSQADNFLVEEFIDAEPVSVPQLDGKLYAPTLRLVFLMIYNKNEIEIVCLGGYYKFPQKSLSDAGSLNERYKTFCAPPYYLKCEPGIMEIAEQQIKEVLHILYSKLLGLI